MENGRRFSNIVNNLEMTIRLCLVSKPRHFSDKPKQPDTTSSSDENGNKSVVKKPKTKRKRETSLPDPGQTSSFIQNILSEDSITGLAVVDLFCTVKTVKNSLDSLVRRNDDFIHQIDALKVESRFVRNEYQNLAQNMRLFLDELNDELRIGRLLDKQKLKEEKSEVERDKEVRSTVSDTPLVSPNLKNSRDVEPSITPALLGSFLASVFWLKRREISLPKSLVSSKVGRISVSDSTLQVIDDFCEIFAAFSNSESEEDEWSSEAEEHSCMPLKVLSITCKDSGSKMSNGNDSDLESYTTPASSFLELRSKPSLICMGDLTKVEEGGQNVSSSFVDSSLSVTAQLAEEIKSSFMYVPKKKEKEMIQTLKKLPDAVEFTIAANAAARIHDGSGNEISRSHSNDSLDTFIRFNANDIETSSPSDDDEMEEFLEATVLNSDSKTCIKARNPQPCNKNYKTLTSYKTARPPFFEMLKEFPKPFVQEIISRNAKMENKNWELKKYENRITDQMIAFAQGEKEGKEVVIETSNLDLVIYIQVEVEEDDQKQQILIDYKTASLGTQTSNHSSASPIHLEEKTHSGKSVYDIWKKCEAEEMKKIEQFNKTEELCEKELVSNTVAFGGDVSDVAIKKEVSREREIIQTEVSILIDTKEVIPTVNEYLELTEWHHKYEIHQPEPFYRPVELEKALELIREIENDVVYTKLSAAILILPRLESELRRHFKSKVQNLGDTDTENSMEVYFSSFDIWPAQTAEETKSESSGERLCGLLALLRDLEKAVKETECSPTVGTCGYNSSKIYGLLHALTESIREVEESSNVTSLSQTLDIASQLDTAVREFETNAKRTPAEDTTTTRNETPSSLNSETSEKVTAMDHLKNVRKKVFQMVEEDAVDTEARLEKDSEKLGRLERANNEAMKFVEAFLEKTKRRADELSSVKTELKELSLNLNELCGALKKSQNSKKNTSPERSTKDKSDVNVSSPGEIESKTPGNVVEPLKGEEEVEPEGSEKAREPVGDTIASLLRALDDLKTRAKMKKDFCKKMLTDTSLKKKEMKDHEPSITTSISTRSSRSSRSSFTAKNVEDLYASMKEFKKIGDHSLYLSWSKPEGVLANSVVGYEIFVNGKLNQKVRKPDRLHAVLYSIDLSMEAEVKLFGLLENGLRIFLSTVTYAS